MILPSACRWWSCNEIHVVLFLQFNIRRISFDEGHAVETLEEAKAALWKLINKGKVPYLQK